MSSKKQCGFCSLLSDLLSRAMCVGPRRGSNDSCYRELDDQDTENRDKVSQQSDDSVEINVLFPRMTNIPKATNECSTDDVSASAEDNMTTKKSLTGRFLTMHKRRKRRLMTRSLCKDEGLLDDLLPGLVQCILHHSSVWRFNAFTLDNVSGGRCLPVLCVYLFEMYGLITHFKLDVTKVWKLFMLIEEGYHSSNPYHNSIHAADVTQAMHCFLQQARIRDNMEPLEVMTSLLAAIAHDLDHPGVNQPFLIATSNHLAALYQNTSVLENHHWRSAVSCIMESGLFDEMQEQRPQLERQISSLILATDITRQQEYLSQFKNYIDTNTLDMTKPEHRHLVLQIALKCADISNPCRPWEISRKWSYKVCEEFFRQGDYERKLNLPVTALCDRYTTSIPKIQTGFFKFVVTPLITEWHRFLKNDLSAQMLENLIYNQNKWETLVAEELAEDSCTEISDADLVDYDLETSTNISESSELLLPPPRRSSLNTTTQRQQGLREHLRRFSVPLNVFQDSRYRSRQNRDSPDQQQQEPDNKSGSGHSLHSQLSISGRCEANPLPEVLSSENLLPDSSIASITTPLQATRLSSVLSGLSGRREGMWKLVRQQTFPPLELNTRALSLVPRASSNDCVVRSRDVKSESGLKFDFNFLERRLSKMFNRTEKTDDDIDLSVSSGMESSQVRDNLNSMQLNPGETDLLTRRRKSMPADVGTFSGSSRERRVREMREAIPDLLRRTFSGKEYCSRRRGSAPASETAEARARSRPSPLPCQWLARAAARRSSLPVEVFHHAKLKGAE